MRQLNFQSTVAQRFSRIKCKIGIDDALWYGEDPEELLATLDEILTRLQNVSHFAAAHKCDVYALKLSWCGEICSKGQVPHDPARVKGLATIGRPRTAGWGIDAFLEAFDWMLTLLLRRARIVEPLCAMLEERMSGDPRRTAEMVSKRHFPDHA